jgi:hypothetical protein
MFGQITSLCEEVIPRLASEELQQRARFEQVKDSEAEIKHRAAANPQIRGPGTRRVKLTTMSSSPTIASNKAITSQKKTSRSPKTTSKRSRKPEKRMIFNASCAVSE